MEYLCTYHGGCFHPIGKIQKALFTGSPSLTFVIFLLLSGYEQIFICSKQVKRMRFSPFFTEKRDKKSIFFASERFF